LKHGSLPGKDTAVQQFFHIKAEKKYLKCVLLTSQVLSLPLGVHRSLKGWRIRKQAMAGELWHRKGLRQKRCKT
jgi:hypothetical protein